MKNMAYQFRLYPEAAQLDLLRQTVGCRRFVYNLAVRLFKDKSAAAEKQPSYEDLCKMLSAWKDEHSFLRDVPHHPLQQSLKDARGALDKCFKRLAKFPSFKTRFDGDACRFPDPAQFVCGSLGITLPKLGLVPWIRHRDMVGRPKSVTVKRDGDHWYASVLVEQDGENPMPGEATVLRGVDLGVARPITTSDGLVLPLPRMSERETERQRRLQKTVARRKKGSKNRRKAVQALSRFHAHLRRRRQDAIRKQVRHALSGVDVLVLEDLNVKGMTASAHGTVEDPGVNVAQKAGLNRSMLDVSFGMIRQEAESYAKTVGKRVVVVNPAYTSQTCACCGHCSKDNRKSQAKFKCVACGHEANADENAAQVIKQRGAADLGRLVAEWDAAIVEARLKAEQAMVKRQKAAESRAKKRLAVRNTEGLSVSGCGAFRGSPRDEAATFDGNESAWPLAA